MKVVLIDPKLKQKATHRRVLHIVIRLGDSFSQIETTDEQRGLPALLHSISLNIQVLTRFLHPNTIRAKQYLSEKIKAKRFGTANATILS